jgi:hypothetical protein
MIKIKRRKAEGWRCGSVAGRRTRRKQTRPEF